MEGEHYAHYVTQGNLKVVTGQSRDHINYDFLQDIEIAVVVRKEIEHIVNKDERSEAKRVSLKQRIKQSDLKINTKCDIWSILHMSEPLLYTPYVDHFKEYERELFIGLCQDIFQSFRDHEVEELPLNELSFIQPTRRLTHDVKKSSNYPDYERLQDLELVVITTKELDLILTDRFKGGSGTFFEKINRSVVDEDAKNKLRWLNVQRNKFLAELTINNFATNADRGVYINVCQDLYITFKPVIAPQGLVVHPNGGWGLCVSLKKGKWFILGASVMFFVALIIIMIFVFK